MPHMEVLFLRSSYSKDLRPFGFRQRPQAHARQYVERGNHP
jgi:hypothetical protein